ncbi:MAG TPA: tRNA uracil 4-sulfurtransferase ThiI [Clostridia bacterium]|nr:tRNA uracil 4-sulfurtransferase ThiI [Clostridia bacterium]
MERTILIRIGEIFLKGNNKFYFVSLLKNNILHSLEGIQFRFVNTQNRMYIENYSENDEEEIISRLTKVFGIVSISPAVKVKTDLDEIGRICSELFPKEGIFRVTVNRADKRFPMTSAEMAGYIGGIMLKNAGGNLKVNLHKFDFEVEVDARENGISYIFYKRVPCSGGLPVGCGGNGMLLLSGGIDSPVAGYLMAKRGVKIYAVHYHSFPYTSEQAKEKVVELARIISRYTGEIELFVVPFTDIQYAIKEHCPIEYMITIMRRFMMRIAQKLAEKTRCGAIITGENLGQVASQTMESINVTNSVVTLPVFRPLIAFDKSQIIDVAREIDTYSTSILPYEDCCTVFLPKNPVIKPRLNLAEEYESRLDVDKLIADAIENVEIINCSFK